MRVHSCTYTAPLQIRRNNLFWLMASDVLAQHGGTEQSKPEQPGRKKEGKPALRAFFLPFYSVRLPD